VSKFYNLNDQSNCKLSDQNETRKTYSTKLWYIDDLNYIYNYLTQLYEKKKKEATATPCLTVDPLMVKPKINLNDQKYCL